MDLDLLIQVVDTELRKGEFGVDEANQFLINVLTELVMLGKLSRNAANMCLKPYGCVIPETCWGCKDDQPNQLAHTDPGGCLFQTF